MALLEPARPTPESVHPSTRASPTTFSKLTEDEKEEYRGLQEDYKRMLKKYDYHVTGLGKIRAEIQRSMARQNLIYTFDCSTA